MIKNKRIVIYGFGKEGIATANFLTGSNKISIIDDKSKNQIDNSLFRKLKARNINLFFGGKLPPDKNFDFIVRSPGVRPDHPNLLLLKKNGAKVTSATNIFFENCPAKIIGVTGTKGKGTTATLIYEIFRNENKDIFLAGNIGKPSLEIIPELRKDSIVVLELSSFQLIDLKSSPDIAVVMMISSEHLDWHKNQNEYEQAKQSIVKFQTDKDFAVINQDFKTSRYFAKLTKAKTYFFSTLNDTNGAFVKDRKIFSNINDLEELIKTNKVLLTGKHNLQNVAAAVAVSKILKISNKSIIKTLENFKGLKHRLQFVKEVDQVKYYNDSYSTTPETTAAAIDAFKNRLVLILGGSSKKSDFTVLCKKIVSTKKIKALILIGQETSRIKQSLSRAGNYSGRIIEDLKNMRSIVKTAKSHAQKGDNVILSPGCASFDMFINYEDRGQQFINEVKKIK